MKRLVRIPLFVLVSVWAMGLHGLPDAAAAEAADTPREIRIYSVPPAFRPGYINVLAQLISTDPPAAVLSPAEAQPFPEPAVPDATREPLRYEAESRGEPTEPAPDRGSSSRNRTVIVQEKTPPPIEFDGERRILTVTARPEEHEAIARFLNELAQIKQDTRAAVYRIAFLRRTFNPDLLNFPTEFRITGRTQGAGLNRDRYPLWANDLKKRYASIRFDDIDIDRDPEPTGFQVTGDAPDRAVVDGLFQTIRSATETEAEIEITEHDYRKESTDELREALTPIYGAAGSEAVDTLIRSLQKLDVYRVRVVTTSVGQSSLPGLYRTTLEEDHSVSVRTVEGVRPDNTFQAEVTLYTKLDEDEPNFDEERVTLQTSLFSRFGQMNIVGLRGDDDQRFLLLLLVEEGRLGTASKN